MAGAADVLTVFVGEKYIRSAIQLLRMTGKLPAQAPAFTATAGLDWRAVRRLTVSADLRYVSLQYDDDLNTRKLEPGLRLDGRAGWSVGEAAEVYVAVENLGDARIPTGQTANFVTSYDEPRTVRVGFDYRR